MTYRPQSFQARVNYAADVISSGAPTSGTFDSCFENHDGDVVVTALLGRAKSDNSLAANLGKYISRPLAEAAAERLRKYPDEELKHIAARYRREGRAETMAAPASFHQLNLF